jgi:ribosome modulation factor
MPKESRRTHTQTGVLRDGYQARLQGLGSEANPHQSGTKEHNQWREGWRAADKFFPRAIPAARRVATP